MEGLSSLPSTTWSSSLLPFVTSDELLSLRATCSCLHAVLHEGKESDIIWRLALLRDFSFFSVNDPESVEHLNAIRVLPLPSRTNRANPRQEAATSVFGGTASGAVFQAETSFASWKHWNKASNRFYKGHRTVDLESDDHHCHKINGPYFLRAAALWSKIELWCDSNESGSVGDRVRASLMDGLFHCDGGFATAPQYQRGTSACQAIFAFYNGQEGPLKNDQSLFAGLLGGYSAYDKCICTSLLPQTKGGRQTRILPIPEEYMIIAASFRNDKAFILHTPTGRVFHYSPRNDVQTPALDQSLEKESHFDSALTWLEELSSRLHTGYFSVGEIIPGIHVTRGILQYPSKHESVQNDTGHDAPPVSCAVTHGVEVVASAVYTPEFLPMGLSFIYSIRIQLLSPDDNGYVPQAVRGFESCQLRERHWQIRNSSTGETDRVDGPGVIGYYPLLREGGYRADMENEKGEDVIGVFSYQSCTGPGSDCFQGTLTFARGNLGVSMGDFDVAVAPFALNKNPQFIF